MTKALSDYILVPLLITYYYVRGSDFKANKKRIYYFYFINLIISIIIVICGLIFNELIILFFCQFEYDTHYEISKRAKKIESHAYELKLNERTESFNSDISESNININNEDKEEEVINKE